MTRREDAERRKAERRAHALRLRVLNMSWPAIVRELRKTYGNAYTEAQCAADVRQALEDAQALLTPEDADAKDMARVLELERLDSWGRHVETILGASVRDGERLMALRAVDRLLAIDARRDSLLGLSDNAEVPPSPEADEVDELKQRREESMLKRAGLQP